MDKTDHLMAEKNVNNKDNQKGQVTPKKSSPRFIKAKVEHYFVLISSPSKIS
jgi:hypothetical protein